MNWFEDPFTITIIVLSAVILLFIVVQLFIRMVLDPFLDYRKLKGQITACLAYYDTFVSFPPRATDSIHNAEQKKEQLTQLQWDLRQLSSDILGAYEMIPLKWCFILFRAIPRRANLRKACMILIAIADNLWNDDPRSEIRLETNWFQRKRVARLLRIRWHSKPKKTN